MKKNIIILIAVAALVSLSAIAFAGPRGGRGAAADAYYNLTPEKRAAVQKIIEAHQDKLYELREKIWAKQAELQALSNSGKAEKSDIQGLVGDISKLRDSMHQERLAIKNEIEKQTGIKAFGPGGFHHGMMMGYGDGTGCPGGGQGRGFGGNCIGGNCN
jgi:zinc resistance-associated protein